MEKHINSLESAFENHRNHTKSEVKNLIQNHTVSKLYFQLEYLKNKTSILKEASIEANIKFHLNDLSIEKFVTSFSQIQGKSEENVQVFKAFSISLNSNFKKVNSWEKVLEICKKELENYKEMGSRLENESFVLHQTLDVAQGVGETIGKRIKILCEKI